MIGCWCLVILLSGCLVVLLSGCFVVCLEDSTERSESNLGRSLGLLSLRSVLASSQSYQQQDNQTTRQFIDISVSVVQSSRQGLVWVAQFLLSHCNALFLWIDAKLASAI